MCDIGIEGDEVPMNLYSHDSYYFGVDEIYYFHIGVIMGIYINRQEYEARII